MVNDPCGKHTVVHGMNFMTINTHKKGAEMTSAYSFSTVFRISQFSTLLQCMFALLFCLTTEALTAQDTQKPPYKQQISGNQFTPPDFFFHPLEYSRSSFKFFLTNVYNHRNYPQHFLALNFIHIVSGINLAPETDQPRRYIRKLFSLFDPKMLNIYINPYAFSELLNQIPSAMAPFCNITKEKKDSIEAIKECIGSCLVDNYAKLKNNPDATLTELARTIQRLTSSNDDVDISIRELQHAYHYFLARGISNLVWSPTDQAETWKLVKTIACQLEKCTEYYMLDEEMLDDLFWVLLQRYAYFIDLCAPDLEQAFFDSVYHDLKTEKAALWMIEEREEFITTKLAYLRTVLMEAEIKSKTSASGVHVNTLR